MEDQDENSSVPIATLDTSTGEVISHLPTDNSQDAPQKDDQGAETQPASEQPEIKEEVVEPVQTAALSEDAKRYEAAKRIIIDNIEEQFDLVDKGRLTQAELHEWLAKDPMRGEIANRSKRVKERYREFVNNYTPSTEPATISLGEQNIDLDALVTKKLEEKLNYQAHKQIENAHNEMARSFASKHGIQDEAFDKLQSNARALLNANDDWTYDQALNIANSIINPQKTTGVNINAKEINPVEPKAPTEVIDMTKNRYSIR